MIRFHALATLCVVGVAGCPSPDDTNPTKVWLAPEDGETKEILVDHDPGGF